MTYRDLHQWLIKHWRAKEDKAAIPLKSQIFKSSQVNLALLVNMKVIVVKRSAHHEKSFGLSCWPVTKRSLVLPNTHAGGHWMNSKGVSGDSKNNHTVRGRVLPLFLCCAAIQVMGFNVASLYVSFYVLPTYPRPRVSVYIDPVILSCAPFRPFSTSVASFLLARFPYEYNSLYECKSRFYLWEEIYNICPFESGLFHLTWPQVLPISLQWYTLFSVE